MTGKPRGYDIGVADISEGPDIPRQMNVGEVMLKHSCRSPVELAEQGRVVASLLEAELDPADASKESGNRELLSFGFWSRGLEHPLRG